jgi:signal transduction histidine kinase
VNAHRRRTWIWFLGTVVLLLAVMGWLTVLLVSLDRDEAKARQHSQAQEQLRLALWRMDSWLSPHLAREAMRPPAEYRAFAPAGAAWTRGFDRLAPDEVVVPSPLLSFASPLFPLHFELGPGGALASPQVPTGNERDVALSSGADAVAIERARARLEAVRPRLGSAEFAQRLQRAESLLPELGCNVAPPDAGAAEKQNVVEYSTRQLANAWNLGQGRGQSNFVPPPGDPAAVGPMVPFWLPGDEALDEPLLVFARRAAAGGVNRMQGVLVAWSVLQRELLALVQDLFPAGGAVIVRCAAPAAAEQGSMLASVPARLVVKPSGASLAGALPTAAILWTTWGMTLLALLVLGFTLRAAIGYGERRARFASAVTHELRTPLTTFRMYSEMLSDGVVTAPEAQREYIGTLRREADRLSRVVENVLAWSRLEQGRFAARRERHGLVNLLQRIAPSLQRRLADAGMKLQLDIAPGVADAVVVTDEDAIDQILFNLADNAAKYARDAADKTVHLAARRAGDRVQIDVRDHGPGIGASFRERIFAPFDRGALPAASNDVPGVGLGLALARGLARDLGGELMLVDGGGGACFRLVLPQA